MSNTALRHRQWRLGLTAANAIAGREGYRATAGRLLRDQAARVPSFIKRRLARSMRRFIASRLIIRHPSGPSPSRKKCCSLLAKAAEDDRRLAGDTHRVRPISDCVAEDALLRFVASTSGRSLKDWDEDIICDRDRTNLKT